MAKKETLAETFAKGNKAIVAGGGKAIEATEPKKESNPLVEALTKRVTEQGKGISSSSSSRIQNSIDDAIAGTKEAGRLTSERLTSERDRELDFAKDSASATYRGVSESSRGYATQTAALKELVGTTDKSIRDLDKRHQEAIMMSDANTASQISGLIMQKEQFLMQQEQNYFQNVIAVGTMQQQEEQFYQRQQQADDQFSLQMEQSKYQFEQNLGIQHKEIGLKEQELNIARERHQLSRDQFNEQKSELNKQKAVVSTTAAVTERFKNMKAEGQDPEDIDAITLVGMLLSGSDEDGNPVGAPLDWQGTSEEMLEIVLNARNSDVVRDTVFTEDVLVDNRGVGGMFGKGGTFSGTGTYLGQVGLDIAQKFRGVAPDEEEVTFSSAYKKAFDVTASNR